MTKFLNISTDNTLGGNSPSDVVVSSQKAVKDYIDQHGGGGSVSIDDTTITRNTDQEIQAVATINANSASGAVNPVFDWVGTLAEYEAQDIETNHPEWVCYITDDFTAQAYDAYTKSQTQVLLNGKVTTGHEVIEYQEPSSSNNYSWYRKYADGWVEQGGEATFTANGNSITLPVAMANTHYVVQLTTLQNTNNFSRCYFRDTTYFNVATSGGDVTGGWQVSGIAA